MKPVFENYNEIVKELKPLGINWGGCGFYANELGSLLKAKNIKFKYVVLFGYIEAKHNTNKLVKSNLVEDFSRLDWYHVMIKVNGKFIDADGIHDAPVFNGRIMKTRTLTDRFFSAFVGMNRLWNSHFDRGEIPVMKKILRKNLVIN